MYTRGGGPRKQKSPLAAESLSRRRRRWLHSKVLFHTHTHERLFFGPQLSYADRQATPLLFDQRGEQPGGMGFDKLNFSIAELPSQSCLSNYYCLFVYLLRGHCQPSHFLCLNCWIQKACVAFGLRMSCNAVSHGPSLTHLCDLERPLAGR